MPKSPRNAAEGPVEVTVESEGREVASVSLISVIVTKSANRVPSARIVLMDGDVAEQQFPLSDGDEFKPGAGITIKAGYDGTTVSIFSGIVVRHRLRSSVSKGSQLILDCRDKAYAMTLDRKNANFVGKSDSDVIKALIGNYAGLKAEVAGTDVTYGEMVQYYCSDWDYMLSRAEVNGQLVIVEDSKIKVAEPQVSGSPALDVAIGEDVIDFDAEIDARTQMQSVEAVAWNPADQKIESASAKPEKLNKQGNLDGRTLASTVGASNFRLQTPTTLDQASLSGWAKARQLKAGLARIQGRVTFQGSPEAKVGGLIELKNAGERFDGTIYVTGVEHRIQSGDWLTTANFGLAPEWFLESYDVTAPPASAWVPGISGLHIGTVKKLDEDPDNQFRVQVTVPVLGEKSEAKWARLSGFYSSNQFGAFFVPEVGDEVVLGFMNDDPSHPVVLGSLYSSKLPTPHALTAENNIKALVTRSKMKIEFDDDRKIITICTPAGNQVILSDEGESITLEDLNNNRLAMSPSGIDIMSPKDINISADGNVSIKAVDNIIAEATQDVSVKGLNVTNEAQVSFTANGNASAELSASGQTTVKGAMVMIN